MATESFSLEYVNGLKQEIEDQNKKLKKNKDELTQLLRNYQDNVEENSTLEDEKKRLNGEVREAKASLDKTKKELKEVQTKLAESQTQVTSSKDSLSEKNILLNNQREKTANLEKNILALNIEITDLKNTCQLKTKENEARLEEQKKLTTKMDWFIRCLNEDSFPENLEPPDQANNCSGSDGGNENEKKLSEIFQLTREKCNKMKMAFEELDKEIHEALQKFNQKLINDVTEMENDRLNQVSNLTVRNNRLRYSDVTNSKTNRISGDPENLPSSSSSATTIQIPSSPSGPVDTGHVLADDQFPLLSTTRLSSSSSSSFSQPEIQSPFQSPVSSKENEDDISTMSVTGGGIGDDDSEKTNKKRKRKSAQTKKKSGKASKQDVAVMPKLHCEHCDASFMVHGVLQEHVTLKHSNCPSPRSRKAVKRKMSLPLSHTEQSDGRENGEKNEIIGGCCPRCRKEFPSVAQLKMHVSKKHKAEHFFDLLIVPLDDFKNRIDNSSQDERGIGVEERSSNQDPEANGHYDPPADSLQKQGGCDSETVEHGECPRKKNVCLCKRRFKQKAHLIRHISHERSKFECRSCPLKFATTFQVEAHILTVHKPSVDVDGGAMDVSNEGDLNDDLLSVAPHPGRSANTANDHDDPANSQLEENDENTLRGLKGIAVTVAHDGDGDNGENNADLTSKEGGTGTDDGNNAIDDKEEDDIECISSATDQNKLKCCWCPLTFSVESAAQAHAKSVHQGELAIAVKAENGGNFACQTCFQTFEIEQELDEHLNTNHLTNVQI